MSGIRRVVGRPNLRPPPGFEHLDGLELPVESPSVPAPAPAPAPAAAPATPATSFFSPPSSATSDEEEMVTHAVIEGHHPGQVVALLQRKAEEGLVSSAGGNHGVQHLDWISGNPRDPLLASGRASNGKAGASDGGLDGVDHSQQWSKSLFYGDWLSSRFGEIQSFLEIQVKRISGSDPKLLDACGISSEYVWLPLADERGRRASQSSLRPFLLGRESSMSPERTSAALRKGKGKEIATEDDDDEQPLSPRPLPDPTSLPRQQVTNPFSSGHSSQSSQQLPSIAALMLAPSPMESSSSSHQPPVPWSSSLPFRPRRPSSTNISPDDNENDSPFSSSPPADTGIGTFVAQPAHRINLSDLRARAQRRTSSLQKTYSFLNDPVFRLRQQKSFIYAVRVVAIPATKNTVNRITGPPINDRKGTILAMGGWVVPPLEERLAHCDAHPEIYASKVDDDYYYKGVPKKVQSQLAMPVTFDYTGVTSPRYFGELAPVWRELAEPMLEDVLWMVWQLVAGKQFCGFVHGYGFGKERRGFEGEEGVLAACPFDSPSGLAVLEGANYNNTPSSGESSDITPPPACPALTIPSRGKAHGTPVKEHTTTPAEEPIAITASWFSFTPAAAHGAPVWASFTPPSAPLNMPAAAAPSTVPGVDMDTPSLAPASPRPAHSTPAAGPSTRVPTSAALAAGPTHTASTVTNNPLSPQESADLAATKPSIPVWLAASPYHYVNFSFPRSSPRFYGVSSRVQPRPGGGGGGGPSSRP